MSKRLNVLLLVLLAIGTVVILVVALGYGIWWLVNQIDHGMLAIWALLATAAIPVGTYIGFRLGQTEARGTVSGLKTGLEAAVGAGRSIAEVKVGATRRVRQADPIPEVRLPVIDITPRRLNSGDEVVDL